MANYFIDSVTGDNGDDGLTMDTAWATLEYAIETGLAAGEHYVWVRRGHSEVPIASISDSVPNAYHSGPLRIIGWPRAANASITQASWTNGSTTVDNIVGLSMSRTKHCGRFVTGPDGRRYMINYVVDTNTVVIDYKYSGTTVTGVSGACTIHADEHWVDDMGTAYGFDDSGWTIKEANWDADVEDLPRIDFDTNSLYIQLISDNMHLHNIEIYEGTHSSGNVVLAAGSGTPVFQGCIFYKTSNTSLFNIPVSACGVLDRCILDGGKWTYLSGSSIMSNVAQYGSLDNGFVFVGNGINYWTNVNVGVEVANADADIYTLTGLKIQGRDVLVSDGMASPTLGNGPATLNYDCFIENWGKEYGTHWSHNGHGTLQKVNVVIGSGDPERRPGGNDSVLEILYDKADAYQKTSGALPITLLPIFEHTFNALAESKGYRYYVQAEGAVAADELWIEVEYIDTYDSTTTYSYLKVTSDETIAQRTGADDWSQYIEVPNISPAITSVVKIKCFCRYYHATNKIYIDPLAVIS